VVFYPNQVKDQEGIKVSQNLGWCCTCFDANGKEHKIEMTETEDGKLTNIKKLKPCINQFRSVVQVIRFMK